jgi:hypothetical protein
MKFTCVGNNHAKKNLLIFKAHFDFDLFLVNQNIRAQLCTHEKSPPLHELSYLRLLKVSYLNCCM